MHTLELANGIIASHAKPPFVGLTLPDCDPKYDCPHMLDVLARLPTAIARCPADWHETATISVWRVATHGKLSTNARNGSCLYAQWRDHARTLAQSQANAGSG